MSFRAFIGQDIGALARSGRAQQVAGDLRWGEGPCWLANQGVWVFSDIPNDRVLAYGGGSGTSVFRQPSNFSNGHFACADGQLLACEHLSRAVTITDAAGQRTVLCDEYQDKRLSSPNDVVEAFDGSIWFSDPTYGILSDVEGRRAECEQPSNRVYRLDRSSRLLTGEIDDLSMPNGLCFSPDGRFLYVADSGAEMGPELGFDASGPRDVYRYAIGIDGRVASKAEHVCRIEDGVPDGMRFDRDGFLWVATGAGIECFTSDGVRLGLVATADTASNLCFGGADGGSVMVTTETSAWIIRT